MNRILAIFRRPNGEAVEYECIGLDGSRLFVKGRKKGIDLSRPLRIDGQVAHNCRFDKFRFENRTF